MTSAGPVGQIRSLGVIDITGNPGGGMRFVRALVPALKRARPDLDITFYGTGATLGPYGIAAELTAAGVDVLEAMWLSTRPWKSRSLRSRLGLKLRTLATRHPLTPEHVMYGRFVEEISKSDVAYFPWPYTLTMPPLRCPIVTTIHDLNFKYFFGVPNFSAERSIALDREIGDWVAGAQTVVSSTFMQGEVARFYPSAGLPPVIRLAPFSDSGTSVAGPSSPLPDGVREPFILCPTQVSAHKNLSSLIAAKAELRRRIPGAQLVLTGTGTEGATGLATPLGIDRGAENPDVIGLGYVTNETIDLLIDRAAVVVNPSLYEAGNGPGLDAWSRGTPVAMSDIPSFLEHISAIGVTSALFDPRDPVDMATKVADILVDHDTWAERATASRGAIARRTWGDVAADYLGVFDEAYSKVGPRV